MSIIKVLGIGSAGVNVAKYMVGHGLEDVSLSVCGYDLDELVESGVSDIIHLKDKPEALDFFEDPSLLMKTQVDTIKIMDHLDRFEMLVIISSLGSNRSGLLTLELGKYAKTNGILVYAMGVLPLSFEGTIKSDCASKMLSELPNYVDSYMVFSHSSLENVENLISVRKVFEDIDKRIYETVRGITDIIVKPGYINVDFKDIRTLFQDSGVSFMSNGWAMGADRAISASRQLFDNDNVGRELLSARYILLTITTGTQEPSMNEVNVIINYIHEHGFSSSDLIWGNCIDTTLGDAIKLTIIATGFDDQFEFNNKIANDIILATQPIKDREELVSLYFLEEEYSPNEIAEVISFLSDIYRAEGGDGIVIKGQQVLEFNSKSLSVC